MTETARDHEQRREAECRQDRIDAERTAARDREEHCLLCDDSPPTPQPDHAGFVRAAKVALHLDMSDRAKVGAVRELLRDYHCKGPLYS